MSANLLDTIDLTPITASLGPEHRWWMDPNIWCGWCGHIHLTCKCQQGGGAR